MLKIFISGNFFSEHAVQNNGPLVSSNRMHMKDNCMMAENACGQENIIHVQTISDIILIVDS